MDLLYSFVDPDDIYESPCLYGEIVAGHACYCSNTDANISKCPIWRNYSLELSKWHNNGDWEDDSWEGGCKYFEENKNYVDH